MIKSHSIGVGHEGIIVVPHPRGIPIIGPALGQTLNTETLKAIGLESDQPRAAIQSPHEPKKACEDHTLNGVVSDGAGVPRAAFAVVADGISQFNFHSARGSALACLLGYALAKELVCNPGLSKAYTVLAEQKNAKLLARKLRPLVDKFWKKLVSDDSAALNAHAAANPGFAASGWSPEVYRKALLRDDTQGYGTTMLFAFHDGAHGFVMPIGDGGIVTVNAQNSVQQVEGFGLKHSDAIDTFLGAGKIVRGAGQHLQVDYTGHIAGTPRVRWLQPSEQTVILMSDGPEETFMLHNETPRVGQPLPAALTAFTASTSRARAAENLRKIAARPKAKPDDHGIAVMKSSALRATPK
jgi:hypothetical protein